MIDSEQYLPISTVEKFVFCQRQAYLQWVEQLDAENVYLVEGTLFHKLVQSGRTEERPSHTTTRSIHLVSHELGVYGIADVVEFREGQPFPVEYKRGKGKRRLPQMIQLGLQALCLEEMLGVEVPEAAIFHGGDKRREQVPIDQDLRRQCRDWTQRAHEAMTATRAPAPILTESCPKCSLYDFCLPHLPRS